MSSRLATAGNKLGNIGRSCEANTEVTIFIIKYLNRRAQKMKPNNVWNIILPRVSDN